MSDPTAHNPFTSPPPERPAAIGTGQDAFESFAASLERDLHIAEPAPAPGATGSSAQGATSGAGENPFADSAAAPRGQGEENLIGMAGGHDQAPTPSSQHAPPTVYAPPPGPPPHESTRAPEAPQHQQYAPPPGPPPGWSAPPRAPAQRPPADPEWPLKEVETDARLGEVRRLKIITQNANGPCSLIALVNVLLLRGTLTISPPERTSVSYEYLSSLLANHLLSLPASPSASQLSSALAALPKTQHGLALDILFSSPTSFAPSHTSPLPTFSPSPLPSTVSSSPTFPSSSTFPSSPSSSAQPGGASAREEEGGELALFQLCDVPLRHGWVYDPAGEHAEVILEKAGGYDRAVEMVVEGDELGEVVQTRAPRPRPLGELTPEQAQKVQDAHILHEFLQSSRTQLTIPGLFQLSDSLEPGSYVALFRNDHLSVLYKRPPLSPSEEGTGALYTLVTDVTFAEERDVVWESLQDVDGSGSEFFDGGFRRAGAIGGDYAGAAGHVRRAEEAEQPQRWRTEPRMSWDDERLARELATSGHDESADADLALAMQLQHEEEARAARQPRREEDIEVALRRQEVQDTRRAEEEERLRRKREKAGRKKHCVVM